MRAGRGQLELDNVQAVLFDLDGTLVNVDMRRFVSRYLKLLTARMKRLTHPARATRAIHQAVAAMFANQDPGQTLEGVLLDVLQKELSVHPEEYAQCLEQFCRNDLEQLNSLVVGHSLSPRLLEVALARGWRVVLATNPIFPRAVVDARVRWGGLDSARFHHVTAYETAHFCKPNPAFFDEVIGRLQVAANRCLMVGNDTLHDLAASQLGMQTCLLTPWVIRPVGGHYKADWQGVHEELLARFES